MVNGRKQKAMLFELLQLKQPGIGQSVMIQQLAMSNGGDAASPTAMLELSDLLTVQLQIARANHPAVRKMAIERDMARDLLSTGRLI